MSTKSVFISYSHSDEEWLDRLAIYLKPLEKKYEVRFWNDKEIQVGDLWKSKIDHAVTSPDVAILLVSHNFFASHFILENELPPLLDAASMRGTKIASVILRACQYSTSELANYQAINDPRTPLNTMNQGEQDTILLELTNVIESWLDNPGTSIATPVQGTTDNRALVFDIDGTLLFKDEDLKSNDKRHLFKQFIQLVNTGFKLVFITGNDYQRQKPRVLLPFADRGLAESVLCFSDGGSRVFDFQSGDFIEDANYSANHILNDTEVATIESIFNELLRDFAIEHEELKTPDISLLRQGKKRLDIAVYPIRANVFKHSFSSLKVQIEAELGKIEMNSDWEILESALPNAIVVRLSGSYVFVDSFEVQNRLQDFFHSKYQDISIPEFLTRGQDEHQTCQVALKPFKLNVLRTLFLHRLRERLTDTPLGSNLSILLGGSTTIDIQRKNVNKAKAILHLIERCGFKSKNLIYFGDEFISHGNDLPVAEMDASVRPEMLIHVGDKKNTPDHLFRIDGFIMDGNGPIGTQNYLRFLCNESK